LKLGDRIVRMDRMIDMISKIDFPPRKPTIHLTMINKRKDRATPEIIRDEIIDRKIKKIYGKRSSYAFTIKDKLLK
jgi:Asp-tRNA(Asn)/Glu-tRNA(Gln) amidotransferase C subunit